MLVLAAALGTARALRGFPGFSMTGDALLHGDLGRRLAAGDGFVSGFVYPISLVWEPLRTLPQPHFLYHPGYAATLAPAIALFGARDGVLIAVNVVLAWLLLPMTYAFTRRLYDRRAAWLATTLLALDTTLVANVRNAGTEVLTMIVVLGAAWLLLEPPTGRRAFALGMLIGVAYLVRPNLAVLAVPAAWWLRRSRATARVLAMAIGTLVVAAPWLLRGWLVAGQPGFSLYPVANIAFETPTFPGTTATYGDLIPRGPFFMLAHHPADVAHKILRLGVYYARQVWFTVNPLVMASFAAALVLRSGPRAARHLADFTALGLVVTAASAILVAAEPRYLAPFAPLLIALGAGAGVHAVNRLAAGWRVALVTLCAVLLAVPLVRTAQDLAREPAARWHDPNLAALTAMTTAEDVIVSDIGRGVTWYTGRWSVQAPRDGATLAEVGARVPVSTIYLSAQAAEAWPRMFGAPLPSDYVPADFTLVHRFADGARLYRRSARGG